MNVSYLLRIGNLVRYEAQGMLICVALWLMVGAANVYSSTFVTDVYASGNVGSAFIKYMIVTGLSVIWAIGIYHVNYRFWKRPAVMKVLQGIVLVGLVLVMVVGVEINGARRWVVLPGGFSLQPSEFAKLAGLVWTAAQCAFYLDGLQRPFSLFGKKLSSEKTFLWVDKRIYKILACPFFFAALTEMQPDMGTALLILAFPIMVVWFAGIRIGLKQLAIVGAFVIPTVTYFIVSKPYRMERITAFWDPWKYQADLGYQTVQSLIAVGSGGPLGNGYAEGTAKYLYLPEAHTDFAFAVWAQEMGFVGSVLLVFLVLAFTFYGVYIALHARDTFGRLLAAGITFLITGQAAFNMLMVCGMLPVTGVPLPFVSYGGSAMLMNLTAIAILANIAKKSTLGVKPVGNKSAVPSLREETRSRFRPRT